MKLYCDSVNGRNRSLKEEMNAYDAGCVRKGNHSMYRKNDSRSSWRPWPGLPQRCRHWSVSLYIRSTKSVIGNEYISVHPGSDSRERRPTTSAGLVLVALAYLSAFCRPPAATLIRPVTLLNTPPISPRAYEVAAESRPWPASAARFGSLIFPSVEYCPQQVQRKFTLSRSIGEARKCMTYDVREIWVGVSIRLHC